MLVFTFNEYQCYYSFCFHLIIILAINLMIIFLCSLLLRCSRSFYLSYKDSSRFILDFWVAFKQKLWLMKRLNSFVTFLVKKNFYSEILTSYDWLFKDALFFRLLIHHHQDLDKRYCIFWVLFHYYFLLEPSH